MQQNKIGIIILAAGSSKRLGKAKQLVKFRGKTLLENSIQTAIKTSAESVLVVLGANANKIKNEIAEFPVEFCINKDWQKGRGSSIKCGLEYLLSIDNQTDAVIIMLCDQPLISNEDINLLIDKHNQTKNQIIATKYESSKGVPALFSKEIFAQLLKIKDDKGAKELLDDSANIIKTVAIPEAAFDIDTNEDVQKLKELG